MDTKTRCCPSNIWKPEIQNLLLLYESSLLLALLNFGFLSFICNSLSSHFVILNPQIIHSFIWCIGQYLQGAAILVKLITGHAFMYRVV